MRLALLASLCLALLTGCDNQIANSTAADTTPAHIEVQGVAEISAVPDRFSLRAKFSEVGTDVAAMKTRLDQQMSQALAAARALGIEDKKIQASSLNVQPEWQWQPERKLIGQRVSRDVQISVDGMDNYIELLDRLTALSPSELQQAGAEVGDLASLEDEVLQRAVHNARHRADILASAAGRELGPALMIIEQGTQLPGPQPLRAMAMESQADKSSYSAGEVTLRSQVMIRFLLD
ncbi:MAG: SIMPL domain-containing protein [Alcanivoracaceae bacterium]|nr:SIMPL domain-containing protein [Alcanivoracaceae bacterium]